MALLLKKTLCKSTREAEAAIGLGSGPETQDPNHIFYLTTCFVCGEKSKPGQEFIRNFGGLACFSCRAFFRRATQTTTHNKRRFICLNNNRCQMSVLNRQNCKSCRFAKCLESGMQTQAVLTTEQKKERFKKMFSKKDKQLKSLETAISSSPDLIPSSSSQCVSIPTHYCHPYLFEIKMGSTHKTNHFEPKLDSILRSYQSSLEIVSLSREEVSGYQDETRNEVIKRNIFAHLFNKAKLFRQFALLQRDFCQLSSDIQDELLVRTSPIYIQLLLAFYMTTSSGISELQQFIQLTPEERYQNLAATILISKLFKDLTDLTSFYMLAKKLACLKLDQKKYESALAYIILFDEEILRKHTASLNDLLILNKIIFEACLDQSSEQDLSHDEFILTLVSMAIFFAGNIDSSENFVAPKTLNNTRPFSLDIVMGYTREEENWLQNQLRIYDKNYCSVAIGPDYIRSYVLFSQGVAFSKENTAQGAKVIAERLRRIYNMHSEFQNLPIQSQVQLMNKNIISAMLLMVAKCELSLNGVDQLQILLGSTDKELWDEEYLPTITDPDTLAKVNLVDHSISHSDLMTFQKWMEHGKIVASISTLVNDPDTFRLLLLLCLTKQPAGSVRNNLAQTHTTYLEIYQRRNKHKNRLESKKLISSVHSDLAKIERLATIHVELVVKRLEALI